MRGLQRPTHGVATFDRTVYPGWYPGRRPSHIHVKVHVAGNVVHTGQLFFNRHAVTDAVYKRTPYSKRPEPDDPNADDSIFVNGGSKSLAKIARQERGTSAPRPWECTRTKRRRPPFLLAWRHATAP